MTAFDLIEIKCNVKQYRFYFHIGLPFIFRLICSPLSRRVVNDDIIV